MAALVRGVITADFAQPATTQLHCDDTVPVQSTAEGGGQGRGGGW